MWKKQALVSIRQGRPSIKSFRFNQQKTYAFYQTKKTKRHYLELTRINPCFVGHGQDFLLKLVQVALTKDTTWGIIKTRTSINMKASLLVSEEASLTALFIVWLKSLNCCPKTSRLILLATTQNTTTENMSTAVSHFKTLRSASTNRRFSILLLTFDTDDSGLSTVYRFWLWSADDWAKFS